MSTLGPESGATVPLSERTRARLDQVHASQSRALLLVYHRNGVEVAPLVPGASIIVGRASPADIVVPDPSLSRRHARFTLDEHGVTVEDLGSTNGVHIAGRRIQQSLLTADDEVRMGVVTASIQMLSDLGSSPLGLESHDAFRNAVQLEVVRARFFDRKLAILTARTLRPRDGHLRHWVPRVRGLLRPVDRMALYSPDTVQILLPEASKEQALKVAQSIVAPADREPILACGVAPFPEAAASAEKLIEVSLQAARDATAETPVRPANTDSSRTLLPSGAGAPSRDRTLIATSQPMKALVNEATRVARSAIAVLLLGETGAGKEVIARLIHEASGRRGNPLIAVNCGAIAANLLESILFGHERGAFTGAVDMRKGVFEAASGGTLLLDEIGELPLVAQAALLRVLETKRVTRMGSTKEMDVNTRVVAATHRDLEAMCDTGQFRRDLLFRLESVTLRIPPLRARREDIVPLAKMFLKQASETNECHIEAIAPEALAILESHAWPGNVRELRNAIERAVVIADGSAITVNDLPERVRSAAGLTDRASAEPAVQADPERPQAASFAAEAPPPVVASTSTAAGAAMPAGTGSLREQIDRFEANTLLATLRETDWNVAEAARKLDLPLRTMQHKMKTHGIKRRGFGLGDPEPAD